MLCQGSKQLLILQRHFIAQCAIIFELPGTQDERAAHSQEKGLSQPRHHQSVVCDNEPFRKMERVRFDVVVDDYGEQQIRSKPARLFGGGAKK